MLDQTHTLDLTEPSGQLPLHDDDVDRNVSETPLNFLQYCQVIVDGQPVAYVQTPAQ